MPDVLFETADPEIPSWVRAEFDRLSDQSALASECA